MTTVSSLRPPTLATGARIQSNVKVVDLGHKPPILENQHQQMENAKEELNEINRELQQKRPEYKRSIAERMDAAVWQ